MIVTENDIVSVFYFWDNLEIILCGHDAVQFFMYTDTISIERKIATAQRNKSIKQYSNPVI